MILLKVRKITPVSYEQNLKGCTTKKTRLRIFLGITKYVVSPIYIFKLSYFQFRQIIYIHSLKVRFQGILVNSLVDPARGFNSNLFVHHIKKLFPLCLNYTIGFKALLSLKKVFSEENVSCFGVLTTLHEKISKLNI